MSDTRRPICAKCSKSVVNKTTLCATCGRFHPNCLQKYAATKDARSCCGASFATLSSQLKARRKSDRLALDRSLSRANSFDILRNLMTH